jgi:hypothetical protein
MDGGHLNLEWLKNIFIQSSFKLMVSPEKIVWFF